MRLSRVVGPLVMLALAVLVTLAVAEGGFTLLLARPSLLRWLPATTISHVRRYYLANDRNMIQAMPACARYDPDLFYTLKPGTFRFRNREFDDEFLVNRLGLRDDEASLRAPAVVVLGDSYAMGWGVAQDETIAEIVEREAGLRALNAGIASYGTVREMRLLDRIDTSRLRYLVIQYCNDDFLENRPFTSHGNAFSVGDEGKYQEDVRRAARRKRYWFGRRTISFLRDVFSPVEPPGPRPATPEDEARYFVNTLLHAGRTDLSGVRLIVFEIAQSRAVDSAFVLELRRRAASEEYPAHIRNMRVLDLTGRLTPEDYYDLDDHLRKSGQLGVARAVLEVIRAEEDEV